MPSLRISLATTVTDRSRPILEGRVPIEGCVIEPVTGEPEDLFGRALRDVEFDVTELSLGSYLVVVGRDESPYVAVPAFPSRAFRHSAVYVNAVSGIERPEDLAGRIVGTPEFQQTAALWVRGILADRHGVAPSTIRWRSGGLESPGTVDRIPIELREDIELEPIEAGTTLDGQLVEGRLDALVTPRPPSSFEAGDPRVRRLWRDHVAEERRFFDATRMFPIMHVVAIRRELAERHPWLPLHVFRAFVDAKRLAIADLERTNFLRVALPWTGLDDVRRLMGDDYWPYGVAANRTELEAVTRWSHAEGLSLRELAIDELFEPSTIGPDGT